MCVLQPPATGTSPGTISPAAFVLPADDVAMHDLCSSELALPALGGGLGASLCLRSTRQELHEGVFTSRNDPVATPSSL